MKNYFLKSFLAGSLLFYGCSCLGMDLPIEDFSTAAYSQNAGDYVDPNKTDYTKPLLSKAYQEAQFQQFKMHYFDSDAQGLSPWSEHLVKAFLPLVKKIQFQTLDTFNNQTLPDTAQHYGENFKAHDIHWWLRIKDKMDLEAIASSEFNENNRAIAIANTYARGLPDNAPDFFRASLPGQGFPFDNLQDSAIWAGTPLYVFSTSKDKAWSLVLTPDAYFGWVKTNDIASVSEAFIRRWQKAAQRNLLAISQTETPILDAGQRFQFSGYIGAVFPMLQRNFYQTELLIPVKDSNNQAVIKIGFINNDAGVVMPLSATPKNMVGIIEQLKNRPYGWGGTFFFNDCSQELKSIFTPLGIWLPRNSNQMGRLTPNLPLGKYSLDARLSLLQEKGRPLMTLIHIDHHVMLYVGTKESTPITYQNVWGLSPANRDKRFVIGQSLFFPLLKQYPENPEANSLANRTIFTLVFLDELNKMDTPLEFVKWIESGFKPSSKGQTNFIEPLFQNFH